VSLGGPLVADVEIVPPDAAPPGEPLLRRWLSRPRALSAAGLLALIVLVTVLSPWISPHNPIAVDPGSALLRPGGSHVLGTDQLGRDVLSRILWGGRVSLPVAVSTVAASLLVGGVTGLVSGYWAGAADLVLMRFVDAILAFPSLVLAIALVAALGPGVVNAIVAIGIVQIPVYARITRAQALQIKTADYVAAARALGTPVPAIIARHLIPNMLSPLIVQASLSAAFAIITEATLSYLGLGAQPPTPDWGFMMNEGAQYLSNGDWWLAVGPAIAISLTVFSFSWLGDALRDLLDPRL
jgi:peptide/nickel transport system permease protein